MCAMTGEENSAKRRRSITLLGLTMLWTSFYASPYYPFSLSSLFSSTQTADVATFHLLYSIALILFFVFFAVVGNKVLLLLQKSRALPIVIGVSGTIGLLLATEANLLGSGVGIAIGFALVLVAFYVSSFLTVWFHVVAAEGDHDTPVVVFSSFALFALMWCLLQVFLPDLCSVLLVVSPLVSLACFMSLSRTPEAKSNRDLRAVEPFTRWVLVLCCILVYGGVLLVRVVTTMEQGNVLTGAMVSLPAFLTAFFSVLLGAVSALRFRKGVYSTNVIIMMIFLVFVYMGALLVLVLSVPETVTLLAKRLLVAAEHCVEILTAVILLRCVTKHRLSSSLVSSLFGVLVCVLPQLISFNLLFQTGYLEHLAQVNLMVPIAAIAAFLVAVCGMGFLAANMASASAQTKELESGWQKEICRKAMASYACTPRELDVVELVYRGYSVKRTSEELLVSESTVKTHLSHTYRKLNVHSKQELIDYIDTFR